jgi:WD40 repeat protein
VSKIFISHSSSNNAIALALARWLELRGWGDYFLDISAERGLSPGERWQAALKVAADRCEAVVFLISPAWRESRWCIAELLLAQQLGKAIFGVVVEAIDLETIPAGMSSQWQLSNLVEGQDRLAFQVELDPVVPRTEVSFAAAGLERLQRGLRRAGLDPSTFPWPPPGQEDRLPYHGLKAMDVEDAPIFFGREAAIITALDTLRRLRQGTAERMFVIVGASGAGKSSFLRAGLLSRLQRDDQHFLPLPVVRPEKAAINGPNGLVASLETALSRVRIHENRADLRKQLGNPSGFAQLLARLQSAAHARFTSDTTPAPTIVLPIDQAEELYTSEAGDEARLLLELIRGILSPPGQGRDPSMTDQQVPFVLLSIRSDSYERLQTDPHLEPVKQYLFSLPPIPKEAYKEIIEGPAARHTAARRALSIDPLLTQSLLAEAGGADALPLLAFTLERLLLEHGGDGYLSLGDYQTLGGVEGSIEAAIQAAFASPDRKPPIPRDPSEREALLRQGLVPWLARIDPDTEERKRRIASWAEIPPPAQPLLERLVEQRLLVRDRRLTEDDEAQTTVVVEVAHEALLRRWPLLRRWLDEEAEALKAIEGARRAAAEWVRHERQDAWLVHGGERLRSVEGLLRQSAFDRLLASRGREYLRACRDREELERREEEDRKAREEEQERRARDAEQVAERERLRVAEVEAEQARDRESAARRLSRRTLAGAAVALVLMLAAVWAAWRAEEQQQAAERTLGASDVAEALRRQGDGRVGESVAYLARAVRLVPDEVPWRTSLVNALITTRWLLPKAEIKMPDETTSATFSPDGSVLLIVAGDNARLWNVATGTKIADLRHRNDVLSTQFSPDGRRVVTGSRDRTVRVWEATSGELVREVRYDSAVEWVSFLGGSRGVVAEVYSDYHIFDVATGQPIRQEPLESRPAVSPDHRYFVFSIGNDVEIWDTKTRSRTRRPVGPMGWQREIGFAPDGRSFLIPTEEQLVYVDAESGIPTRLAEVSYSYEYNGTGRAVVLWAGGRAIGFNFEAWTTGAWITFESGEIATAKINEDATRIVTSWSTEPADEYSESPGEERYRVQVWDTTSGTEIGPSIHRPSDDWPAFCPSGKRFVTRDGAAVSTWDTAAGERVGRPIVLARAAPSLLRIDDDCRYALVASSVEAHVWDLKSGAPVGEPLIHEADIVDAAFNPDGVHLATVTPLGVRVWDIRSGAAIPQRLALASVVPQQNESEDNSSSPPELVISSDTRYSAVATSTEIVLRNEVTGARSVLPLTVDGGLAYSDQAIPSLELSRDGRRLIARLWNSNTGAAIQAGSVDGGGWIGKPIRLDYNAQAASSPDGSLVVVWSEKAARIWKVETGKPVGKLIRHRHPIESIAFSDNSRWIATASSDGTARVWSALTGEAQGEPMRHQRYASRVEFSGDGKYLLTVGKVSILVKGQTVWQDREVRVWRVPSGEPLTDSKLYGQEVTGARINADGSRAVTLAGDTATLWDPATGAAVGAALEHNEKILTAAFSPDGKRLATVAGSVIRLWDAVRSQPISFPMENADVPRYVSFTPDGQRLLAVSNREARIWDVASVTEEDVPLLAEVAEVVSGRRITDLGALEPLPGVTARLAQLREFLAAPPGSESESIGRKIARWLLMDPQRRGPTPLAGARPPEAASPRSQPGAPAGG